MWNESFFSAPQLKRDSLGGSSVLSRILASSLAMMACAGSGPSRAEVPPVKEWVGCYALKADSLPAVYRSTDWGLLPSYPLPDSIALESGFAGLRSWDDSRQYSIRVSYSPAVRRIQEIPLNWTPITRDSIDALVWADGFRAIMIGLSRRENALVGRASWETDDLSAPRPSASVEAVPVPCPISAQHWARR